MTLCPWLCPPGPAECAARRGAWPTSPCGPDVLRASRRRNNGWHGPRNRRPWHWHVDRAAFRYSRGKSSLGRNFDGLGIAPQALQIVIRAGFWRKNVYQEISIVGQNPFRLFVTFHTEG